MAESKIKGLTKVTFSSDTSVTISANSTYSIDIDRIIPSGMIPLFATSKRNGSDANAFLVGCPFQENNGWKVKVLNYNSMNISMKPYVDVYCI